MSPLPRRASRAAVVAAAALLVLLATACGTERAQVDRVSLPEPANRSDLARLTGDIVADGSSTVYPVTAAAAEEFMRYANGVRISVGISGTGGGFKKFCSGETHIQNASRPISTSEAAACKAGGIEYIELPVAYDGLAVVINPENTWAACLTRAELKKIWEPSAQGVIENWSQVRSTFPNVPLNLYGPGTDSGTFEYFTEAITGKAKDSRGDFQASENDNVLVTGIGGDRGALGYFGLAYYQENASKLQLVKVDNKGDGSCIAPTVQTVNNGTYQPLSRPIFIYVRTTEMKRLEVAAYINFYLGPSYTPLIESREVGYVGLTRTQYESITQRFNAGTTGTLFPNGAEVGATLDRYR